MSHSIKFINQQVRESFQLELADASNDPTLGPLLSGRSAELLPRFARYHAHLTQLPRRARRTLQRQWRRSLSALALLLALGQATALAATIPVNGSTCTLINAITAANTDSAVGGCPAGSGADILQLVPKSPHTLTTVNNVFYGNNGLPVITSDVTIEGHGRTIKRRADAPAFRILAINDSGDLTLNETTVSGGLATASASSSSGNSIGGGIYNYGTSFSDDHNRLTITNSTISGNSADIVDGVLSQYGELTITNSTISGNSGIGVFNVSYRNATITNSTVSGNRGTGITNSGFGQLILANSTVSGNGGVGIFIYEASVTLIASLVTGNSSFEIYNYSGSIDGTFNVLGHAGRTNEQAFFSYGLPLVFMDDPTNIIATSDGTNPTALANILNPTLTRSGGPTQTHNLVKGSPAVDALTTGCPPPATDQRGVPRPQGAACDIGAVELVLCNGRAATLVGTAGNNVLTGTSRRDIIHGLGGNDRIFGLGGNDILCGGTGRDSLNGGSDIDGCDGGSGTDTVTNCEAVVNVP